MAVEDGRCAVKRRRTWFPTCHARATALAFAFQGRGFAGSESPNPAIWAAWRARISRTFFPQLARSLLNIAGVKAGDHVLDPMCGSGTTLIETSLLGCAAFGVDMNPLSVLMSRGQICHPAHPARCAGSRV